jgi:hypothetical protein
MDLQALSNKINTVEQMFLFENRRKKGIILGTIFGIPCTITHHHAQNIELWNGEIIEEHDTDFMFTIDFELVNTDIFNNIYLNKLIKNCPDITDDIFQIILNTAEDNLFELTTDDLGVSSKYLMIRDHVFSYHLSKEFNKHPYLEFIHTGGDGEHMGFIINIKKYSGSIYIDTVIFDIFNIISTVFEIQWQNVKTIDVWNYQLPNIIKFLVIKRSNISGQKIQKMLANKTERNKQNISGLYKKLDSHNEPMFRSVAFIHGDMNSNRPSYTKETKY